MENIIQQFTCPMHPDIRQKQGGLCPECGMNLVPDMQKSHKKKDEVFTCPMHPEIQKEQGGLCPECGMVLLQTEKKNARGKEGVVYSCSMHPEVEKEIEGLCPECGMQLVAAPQKRPERKMGGRKKDGGHGNVFKTKFWVSFALTVPVLAYSDIVTALFGFTAPVFPGSRYLPAVFGSVIFWYAGWVFLASAYRELRARMPGMMTLIALAVTTAYVYSIAITFFGMGKVLYWELASLITIMLLGHWMEMRAVTGAQGALKELSKLLPDTAEVVRNGGRIAVPLAELKETDRVFVRPGSKIPADGIVEEGSSAVNEALVTGESKPVSKQAGDTVIAGAVNGNGSLTVRVTGIGERTFLAGVMRLVADAQASKSKLQLLSDRAAYWLTVVAISGGALTFMLWSLFSDAGTAFAITRLVAVLVITCPHALGLAIPLVASISTTMAARNGFLIRERAALESARAVDVVLFDKTGTLTVGEYGVDAVWPVEAVEENTVLKFAASVDSHSEHFIAYAIVKEARKRGIGLADAKDFERLPGMGVHGIVDGDRIMVGGESMLAHADGAELPRTVSRAVREEAEKGKTVIYVLKNGKIFGVIALADKIREESREAVAALKELGVRIAMLTGDSEEVAAWVARELGMDEYFARVLPDKKADIVKKLQEQGKKVAMVGDGINDAPALTQADVGIAIGAGTNVAVESAGIILVRNDPRDITKIIKLSRMTYAKMIQNLFWATGYNVIALPLAAGVLASKDILLQPAVAALLMSVSTVIVAINAVLLKNKELS